MKEDILERLKKISERIKREYKAEKVILFGSYARGEEKEHSDVDLLVIAPSNERIFERMANVLETVHELYDNLPLSPIVLTPSEVEERIKVGDQFIKEILEKGIEL
jgi:predicted nucleotidyltransferase